jgi:hypothetical protein
LVCAGRRSNLYGIEQVNEKEKNKWKIPCVYILGSYKNGNLYTGVSNNLAGRIYQFKEYLVKGFT